MFNLVCFINRRHTPTMPMTLQTARNNFSIERQTHTHTQGRSKKKLHPSICSNPMNPGCVYFLPTFTGALVPIYQQQPFQGARQHKTLFPIQTSHQRYKILPSEIILISSSNACISILHHHHSSFIRQNRPDFAWAQASTWIDAFTQKTIRNLWIFVIWLLSLLLLFVTVFSSVSKFISKIIKWYDVFGAHSGNKTGCDPRFVSIPGL